MTRDVEPGRALLERAAHHHILDLARIDIGALYSLANRMSGKRLALRIIEGAAIRLADRGAGGGDDYGFAHGVILSRLCYFENGGTVVMLPQ